MYKVFIIIALVVVVCVVKLPTIERFVLVLAKPAPTAAVSTSASVSVPPHTSGGGRTATLRSDGRGHFEAEARVDGRYLSVLVDTGASMIALRESAANRLGIFPSARDYSLKIQTANGTGRAARVQLSRVEIGDVVVRDVEAFVVPDEALTVNLLGMSFLSRVKWTHDRGRLVLEQ